MFVTPNPKRKTRIGAKKKPVQVEPPPKKPEKKPIDGRKYAQIAPESVKIKAESVGIDDLNDDVAKALSEEVSYRLRELIFKCTIYMRQTKCTKLRREHVKSVFAANDLDYTFGHLTKPTFSLIGETDIFVKEDTVCDLEEMVDLKEDYEQVQPTIIGKIVLPDKVPKPVTSAKKTMPETGPIEGKTTVPDKPSKSTAANKTQETEPLEALGLRKVTKT